MRASPPLPSFSRAHDKPKPSTAARTQSALAALERCVEASRLDLAHPQFVDRARLLCRQGQRAASKDLATELTQRDALLQALLVLEHSLSAEVVNVQKTRPEIKAVQRALDSMHKENDPVYLEELRLREAKWQSTGTQLRFALRNWRRCLEEASSAEPDCDSSKQASQRALSQFGASLDNLVTARPFGTRSFRRCAQRSLLPQPPEARGIAQKAPDSPQVLRSCERMATRIPWQPL